MNTPKTACRAQILATIIVVSGLWSIATAQQNQAPVFYNHPQSQTVAVGSNVQFVGNATATPTPTYQLIKNNVTIVGATSLSEGGLFRLSNVTLSDAGSYTIVATNIAGRVSSNPAILTVTAPPVITVQPTNQTPAVGGAVTFTIAITGSPTPTLRWQRSVDGGNSWANVNDDSTFSGATTTSLTITGATLSMTGHQFRAVVSSSSGPTITSSAAVLSIAAGRLSNVSVRGPAGTGAQTLIVGIVTAGSADKSILIRGVGPGLLQFGVTGILADPQIALFGPSGISIGQNNDWSGIPSLAAAFTDAGAFQLSATSRDAALIASLSPGTNTAQISGVGGATGVVLAEAYDLDKGVPATRIVNVSVRNQVGLGDSILVVGFSISGVAPQRLLVRGVGPGLSQFGVTGVLENPRLQIYSGSSLVIDNDDWAGAPQLTAAFTSVAAFPLPANSRDAALVLSLQPGTYTAQVSGVANTTGIALVELYELP
jgi:hypothetical protein